MGLPPRLLRCLFLALSLAAVARAATRHYEWEISCQFKHSDCVGKLAVTINGQTPGTTIRATHLECGTVVVRVKNSLLTENVAIHWHGIRQLRTHWVDGILPGDVLAYTCFVVDRPSTYMLYHAHYGMQRTAGLIVVAAAPGGPDAEPFTSLSALIQDDKDVDTADESSVNVQAVASCSTRSHRPPMAYGQQLGVALVVVGMLYFQIHNSSNTGVSNQDRRPAIYAPSSAAVEEHKPAEGTITSRTISRPLACSPSRSGPADSNPSGNLSTPPSEERWIPFPTFVIGLSAIDAGLVVAIRNEFESIVGGWSTAPKMVYAATAILVIVLLAVALVTASCLSRMDAGSGDRCMLWVLDFCVKLAAILSLDLLLVLYASELGRWACVAVVSFAAVATCLLVAGWIWWDKNLVANAVVRLCRRRQPAGDDMV